MTQRPHDTEPPELDPDLRDAFHRICKTTQAPAAMLWIDQDSAWILATNETFGRMVGRTDLDRHRFSDTVLDPRSLPFAAPRRAQLIESSANLVGHILRFVLADGSSADRTVFSVVVERTKTSVLLVSVCADPSEIDFMEQQFRARALAVEALAELRGALLRGDATNDVFETICTRVQSLVRADHAGLLAIDDSDTLRVEATEAGSPSLAVGRRFPVQAPAFSEWLLAQEVGRFSIGEAEVAQALGDPVPGEGQKQSHCAVAPVAIGGQTRGALVARRTSGPFTDEELALLKVFAGEISEAMIVADQRAAAEARAVRTQVARDLHDEVIQDIIGVRLGLVSLIPEAWNPNVELRLSQLLDDLDRATKHLRDSVAGLESDLGPGVFSSSVRSVTRNRAARVGMGWSVETGDGIDAIDPDLRTGILRVLSEALSNVVRHSDGTQVDVRLDFEGEYLVLVVEDDGVGLDDMNHTGGLGLRNMDDRAAEFGGGCSLEPNEPSGACLRWWIPIEAITDRV